MELKTKKKYLAAIVTARVGGKLLKPSDIKRNYVVINEGIVHIWVYGHVLTMPFAQFVILFEKLRAYYENLLLEEKKKAFQPEIKTYEKEISDVSKVLKKLGV